MGPSPTTRSLAGSALAGLLVGTAFFFTFRALERTRALGAQRTEATQAVELLAQGLSDLKDAETGQRGYLLTGSATYLKPYAQGQAQAQATLAAFARQPAAAGLPPRQVAEFETLADQKLAELDRTLDLAQHGHAAEALAVVRGGAGLLVMDRIRELAAGFATTLNTRRTEIDGVLGAERQHLRRLLLILGALAFAALGAGAWALQRGTRRRAQAERSLAAAEARSQLMLSGIRDYAILMLDPEGRVATWNTGAARIKGYTAGEILGRSFSVFYPEEDQAAGRPAVMLETARTAGRVEEEAWRVRKDGSRFWAGVVITALRGEDGALLGFVKVTRDLTERRRAEEELKASERRFRTLAEAAPVGIFEMDPTGHRPYINGTLCALAGLSFEEATAQGFRHRIHPDDLPRVLGHWERVRAEGLDARLEYRFVLPDGTVRWVESRAAPLPAEDGRPANHIGIVVDRTEQRRAEEELRASERRFRTLAEEAPVGIYEYDFQRGMIYANGAHCRLAGIRQEEATRERLRAAVHPEDRTAIIAQVESDIREGKAFDQIYRLRHEDGAVLWVHSRGTPVEDEPGHPVGYLIVTQDITAMRAAEAEIRAKADALEAANKELEAFAYSVSHDLRAPLRHIDGFVGLLRRSLGEEVGAQARHQLEVISASARQMGALIDDLLTFSRMGRAEVRKVDLDLTALAQRVVQDLAPDAAGRPVEWHLADLPRVQADPALLRLVLLNLMGNALKFTRERAPARIEVTAEPAPGSVAVTIRDNGAGFDMRYADKLFGVFQRLHRQDEFEGTGIGLANVARIIHKHGGTVAAHGEPGAGARFTFTLPVPEAS